MAAEEEEEAFCWAAFHPAMKSSIASTMAKASLNISKKKKRFSTKISQNNQEYTIFMWTKKTPPGQDFEYKGRVLAPI